MSFDSFEASDAAIKALNNQHLLNRPMAVTYALKKDAKHGERHGSEAERLVAAQARKNQVLPGNDEATAASMSRQWAVNAQYVAAHGPQSTAGATGANTAPLGPRT